MRTGVPLLYSVMVRRDFSTTMLSAVNGTAFGFDLTPAGNAGPPAATWRRITALRNDARGATARAVLTTDFSIAFPSSGWRGVAGTGADAAARVISADFATGRDLAGAPFTSFGGASGAFFLVESPCANATDDASRSEREINIDCAV